jgi:hypothetical protein
MNIVELDLFNMPISGRWAFGLGGYLDYYCASERHGDRAETAPRSHETEFRGY